jgi:hypothetical protein
MTVNRRVKSIAHHRNGVGGASFDVVLFTDCDGSTRVGIVFDADWHTAVLDVQKLAEGDIAFGSNSWRGDDYDAFLRTAIRERNDALLRSLDVK